MADKDYIKTLIKRDEPMAMKGFERRYREAKHKDPIDLCGNCGDVIIDRWAFCPYCGQRIDHENYQF